MSEMFDTKHHGNMPARKTVPNEQYAAQKQQIEEMKLRRLYLIYERLSGDLRMYRITASEACKSIIDYCEKNDDPFVAKPSPSGKPSMPSSKNDYIPSSGDSTQHSTKRTGISTPRASVAVGKNGTHLQYNINDRARSPVEFGIDEPAEASKACCIVM